MRWLTFSIALLIAAVFGWLSIITHQRDVPRDPLTPFISSVRLL